MSMSIQPVFTLVFNVATAPGLVSSSWSLVNSGIGGPIRELEIYNNTSQTLILATGNSGSEVQLPFTIFPNGNPSVPVTLSHNTRLTAQCVGSSATAGTLIINLYR